ncbi:MAG: hypothetical protein KatS3mg082_2625 [Nitrospiraceae bacterium]|nr:MAG: hypothetical protein KatS3mg082_2625 [Nitrospiraceae bacterium]
MQTLLHIYGQRAHHDDVLIVGTQGALRRLCDALTRALRDGVETMPAYTADGEGYEVAVVRHDAPPDAWERLKRPYSAAWIQEADRDRLDPALLLDEPVPVSDLPPSPSIDERPAD